MRKILIAAAALSAALVLSACERDADVASYNLSKAADMFEIDREVTFINGITGEHLMKIEGKCSLGNADTAGRLSVTCKTGPNAYKKHFLGLSDNVTFIAQQMEPVGVSVYHHRVIFRPQSVIPDIDVRTDRRELVR